MTKQIPLHNRKREVIAHTLIDEADWDLVKDQRWCLDSSTGYVRCVNAYLHRVICGLEKGDKRVIDHISRDKLDNRRSNLRVLDKQAHNTQNVPAQGGSSRFRGVHWDNQCQSWVAQISLNGKSTHIGRSEDEIEAARMAESARQQYMPFAMLDPELMVVA